MKVKTAQDCNIQTDFCLIFSLYLVNLIILCYGERFY